VKKNREMRQKIFSTGINVALLLLAAFLMTTLLHSQEKTGRSSWTWNNSDDGRKIEVKVESKVEFNDDYSDVTAVANDGALRIYDSRGPRAFRLAITPRATGELRRDYSVNGQSRSFDEEGREWLRAVLLQAVREGGLDVRNRAHGG
jgi:hypothetical protein